MSDEKNKKDFKEAPSRTSDFGSDEANTHIKNLIKVKTTEDMEEWLKLADEMKIPSMPIKRFETLEEADKYRENKDYHGKDDEDDT